IASVRNLPMAAPYGLSMLFFYTMAVIFFLVPTALVSAELASTFPEQGGVYMWVSKAFGPRFGFFAVWLQNINNFICFPAVLSFVASTIAYGFFPELSENKIFTLSVILIVIWGGTLLTLQGIKLTGFVSAIGSMIGTFLPAVIIVSMCVFWLVSGRESQIKFSTAALLPEISGVNSLVLYLGILLGFAGIEMSANHIQDVDNPQKNYPRAILLASILILAVSVLGSLGIAIVVPKSELTLNAGCLQALSKFFETFNISWMTPVLSLMITCGSIAWFCTWVSGPPRALFATVQNGFLPPALAKLNKHGMPTNIMLMQAVGATVLSLFFVIGESFSAVFLMLSVLTVQFLLLMYVLIFSAAIVLRFKYPDIKRGFSVQGGTFGMILVAIIGLTTCATGYVVGFFPPSDITVKNPAGYVATVCACNIIIGSAPFVLEIFKRKSWKVHFIDISKDKNE
ncbi:MAG: amino acid permease, partial [Sphingobacteriia bacterium]|nr:amino acid permease [Sphingobacteriia bacterium]